jgi:hypothetical protein
MAAKKTKKSLKPQSAPAASKLNLVALKPLLKTQFFKLSGLLLEKSVFLTKKHL